MTVAEVGAIVGEGVSAIFATNASFEPAFVVWKAPGCGKSVDAVNPATYATPEASSVTDVAESFPLPPRNVE